MISDEEILAALDMLRSGASIEQVAVDEATLRQIMADDITYSGEDVSGHYGVLE